METQGRERPVVGGPIDAVPSPRSAQRVIRRVVPGSRRGGP